ncbi:MAG TPA: hypothetical protein VG167_19060 [Verrucomicrobiae bacterium]|nr:hypothetical protein [Verrucomicrobiae bacterium]
MPYRLVLRFGRRFNLRGVKLVIVGQNKQKAELLREKMDSALNLIQANSPKFWGRVQKFIPNILIFGAHPYYAVYISEVMLCDIDEKYAASETTEPASLAMTLIHEATHGYLEQRGLAYEEKQRARIEHICVGAEAAFASRIPGSDNLVREAQSRFNYSAEHWTDEAFIQRDLDQIKSLGAPRWLQRLAAYLHNRRTRRAVRREETGGAALDREGK